MGVVVSVDHLTKTYGTRTAVDDVSIGIAEGEVVALLGPNGAGKTTTIEILEGLRVPSAGRVRVLGVDPRRGGRRLRNRMGVVLQSSGMDATLRVAEIVGLYGSFFRPRRAVDAVVREVGLDDCAGTRIGELSGGQRRRVDLALALVGEPSVLFLDEPTTGLDPAARRNTWDVVDRLRERGLAILLTSHYLEEVQRLADRVVVLSHGRIVAEGRPGALGRGVHASRTAITFRLDQPVPLPSGPWEVVGSTPGAITLATSEPVTAARILLAWSEERGVELEAFEIRRSSLEDEYLRLTSGP